jgi:hypothetical protein
LIKSDFSGGILMFVIMFTIAIVQIYILKHVRAFQSNKEPSVFEQVIFGIGGGIQSARVCPPGCKTRPQADPLECERMGCPLEKEK